MTTSWVDFYNQLTNNGELITQRRNSNITSPEPFRLNYGASGSGTKAAPKSSKKKSKSFLDDKLGLLKYLSPATGLADDIIAKGDDSTTPGARLIDVLSRGNYASANAFKSYYDQGNKGDEWHGFNPLEVLKEAGEGLAGTDKTTFRDVNEVRGMNNDGFVAGLRNFVYDVALDPTTYVGAGAVKAVASGAKKIGKATKLTSEGTPLVRQPEAVVNVSKAAPTEKADLSEFIRNVTRNTENPGQPAIFDNVIDQTGAPVSGAIPSFERLFTSGPDGVASERLMLPGPTPDVISGRVKIGAADELARKVPQFQYGEWIDNAPETGPYKETVTKVPADVIDNGPDAEDFTGLPESEAERARRIAQNNSVTRKKNELREKYKDLTSLDSAGLANARPEVKVILTQVEEPVFPRYVQKTKQVETEAGRAQTIKVWEPHPDDVKDGLGMPMGEIRRQIGDPKVSPTKRAKLLESLANHINAVESYVKSKPPGFTGKFGDAAFYREMYGRAPKDVLKGGKALAKAEAKSADDLGVPKSPFEDTIPEPTFTEVREWQKMNWVDKLVFMQTNFNGLKPEHMTYLSQANNQKSFATRLRNLQTMVKEGGTSNASDLVDAIRTGRVQALDEEGIPELLAHYEVTTLKQLAAAVEKDLKTLSTAEKKMLGKITDTPITKDTIEAPVPAVRETGPTGLAYAPYQLKLKKQVKAATEKAIAKSKGVIPAEKIIEGVMQGNKSAIETPKVVFNGGQRAMFDKALALAVDKDIIQPKDTNIWKWVTATGVKRTASTRGKGTGRVQDAWNVYSQYDFFKALVGQMDTVDASIKDTLNKMEVRGPDRLAARADYAYRLLMEPMRAMDNVLKQGGIFPVAGTRQYDTPFSFHDAFASLPEEFVKKNIFTLQRVKTGYASRIAPTQLMNVMDIGVAAMRTSDSADELPALLRAALLEVKTTNAGKKVPNYMPHLAKTKPDEVDTIVNDIIDSLPDLAQKAEKNAAERKLWHENQQFEGTQAALDEIAARVYADDYNVSEAFKLADDINPTLKAVTRSKGLDENDAWAVQASVNAALPDLVSAGVRAEAKRAHLRTTAKTKVEKTKRAVDESKESLAEVSKHMPDDANWLDDFANKSDAGISHRFVTSFFPHWDNANLRPFYLNHNSAMQTVARTFQGEISKISKTHAKDDISAAWKDLQIGRWSSNPAIKAAQVDLNKAIGIMFDDDASMSLFNRRGLTASELNAHFEHYKINNRYHFENDSTMHNAWRQWDSNDPLQLMSQVMAATMKTTGKKLLGDQMMHMFGSPKAGPGLVKLKGNHEILRYVDTENYYFPREIAREMHILNKFLEMDMVPGSNSKALRTYDAALHAYKSGLTIYRPGHHVRNMVGDVWLSFMAGVNNPKTYTDSLRVMAQMRGRYDDFDAIKALAAGDNYFPEDASTTAFVGTKIGGKAKKLTASEVYRGLYDRGLLPDYRTLEDVQIGEESATIGGGKIKPFGGKVHAVAATISESRDHFVRIGHAIDVLNKGNFKTLDEGFDKAAATVRKWHPDGSDLTHFERKYMRRTVLFYSWVRKAIPLVLEGMVMNPGRAMVYPKAIYNMAEANGIDLESYSNPFPTDRLFPSWITEGLQGPLWETESGQMWSINPGVPMMDILGDYGGNSPVSTIVGSVTPLAKIPIEMAYGEHAGAVARDVRTDIPIYDKSDYIDKQIPNSNLLTGLTGRSPSNLFLEPKGGPDNEIKTDSERTLINFLSGLGLQDIGKYEQQAKRERTMKQNGR